MNKVISTIVLSFILLIAACNFGSTPQPPAPEQPKEEAPVVAATEALETLPSPTPAPVPPLVVRSSPAVGEEQPLEGTIEIVFDQPMDRESVEKAFAIEPGASVDGRFEWTDDQTVRFKPDDGFERGQRYKVRVVESAKSQAGLEMNRPFELRFSAVGFLEVGSVQPADGTTDVLPDTVVTILFNRPVVPLNAIEDEASLPDPLTFVPPVTGQGKWLNTSIYQFTPAGEGFAPATEYKARVAKGLTDAVGNAALEDDFEWSFTTVAPQVVAGLPAEGDIYVSPTPVISLAFNQLMERASVEENFMLVNEATGEIIPGKFNWAEGGITQPTGEDDYDGYYDYTYAEGEGPEEVGVETVAFTPETALEFETIYRVELPQGTGGKIAGSQTLNDFNASFTVTPYPAVVTTFPADGDEAMEPWQALQITFNAPMEPASLVFGENLTIRPTVAATQVYTYWWSSNTSLEISFPTEASSRYTVSLGPDIKGRYGQELGVETEVTWETRAQSPLVYMHSPGRIATYNAYTDTLAYVTVRNLGRVIFDLYSLPKEDFIRLTGYNWWEVWDAYWGDPQSSNFIASWELETTPELNDNVIYRVDLGAGSGLGDRLPPGLYYLEATALAEDVYPAAKGQQGEYDLIPERKILVVSHNNITFKSSVAEGLAWVTDLESGQPVADAPVTFYADEADPVELGQATTDDDGVALADYGQKRDAYEARYVFVGNLDQPDDNFAVTVNNWSDGIDRYMFDNVSVEDYQQPYNGVFYTDRNIYRPGQMVYYKGILRGDDDAGYSLPTPGQTANITVFDSQGKEIVNEDIPLSGMGTLNGSFELDENAALGFYSIQVLYDGDNYFYDDFQVAAYRKPEFLVSVETDKPEYAQGEKIKVTTSAEFFFGGPVSNATVRWTLLTSDYAFQYAGEGFYEFTDYDYSRSAFYYNTFDEIVSEGEGRTDAEGRFTFEVEADIAAKIASQRFTIDITITDLNNQEVASQATAIVHKGLFYVGLRPERYVDRVNQESRVNVLVVDWESQPVPDQEVEIVFAEHNWYSVQQQYEDGSFYWDSVVETIPIFTTTVTSDQDGRAVASFTPSKGGIYRVTARAVDRQRNEVRSSSFIWVSGAEYVNWRQENNDTLALVADKREYNVGDTATVLVPHPYSGTVQALVTLERGHIYEHFVTELETNSEQLEIPITEEMIPNMYISVVVIQGSTLNPQSSILPSFKVGYASLPINTQEKELQITLTPNKPAEEKYQPGETVEYFVNVTDFEGEPVSAELSLALVDKAVLSLAPEQPGQLMSAFWRDRGLGVQTAGGLTLAIDRVNLTVAPEAKGGGGGFDEGFGVIRGEFKDTALWLADFKTDAQGQGTVEVELPDNLTTWTMTGKGVTGADTRVGEGTVEIVSTKPLLVRPVAPRFFVVNDQALLGVIVQNNSNEDQDVEVRLEATGVELGGEAWRIEGQEWHEADEAAKLTVKAGERVKVEYNVTVEDVETVSLTMGTKSADYGDALTFELPVYRFSTPETTATAGLLTEEGTQTEGIDLPDSYDPSQGELTVQIDPSLAAGMRDGLDYLEHFPYECTEQTVSRFLPNVFTYRAYQQLNLANPELEQNLPGLVSVGLQRLYNQQHIDGGWGWFILDESDPFLTAYVLLGLVEARQADFSVNEDVILNAASFLEASLIVPKDVDVAWKANRQAFILYVLAEAGQGDLGRSVALFDEREKLDIFGRAYLAMTLHLLDEEADQIETLLNDITSTAITSATGAHWEETQVDYYAMNTDTRSTAIIIAALSRIQPDHPILPNAVRWLMSVRENGGHWETTQETAWAIIGLTDWMVATGELEGNYAWTVTLNGAGLGEGSVNETNIDETTKLRVEIAELLADTINRLAISRDTTGTAVEGGPGRLYYAAYLTYYKPVQEVKALDRGIIVSRQYSLAEDEEDKAITEAKVGDVINVRLTLIAPNDLHYVKVEDPFPAGTEGIDTSLATTSVVGQAPEIERTDRRNRWGFGWWYFSHSELRDEKAVLFATYLPKGTYEYTYQIRASLSGEFNVIPTHAEEMYFPEVFGRGDGGLFKVGE
jgi:hypothetical protein